MNLATNEETSPLKGQVLHLILIMASIALAVAGISIWLLYDTAFEEEKTRLVETAQSQARLIEAVARFDAKHSQEDHPEGAAAATLGQISEAHENYLGFGETGEFTLADRQGDQIVFLLRHRHSNLDKPKPVPWQSETAEPMRRALQGQSGIVVGPDYRGITVLAAHEPVAVLNLGIVAKIDLAEIRAPFIKATIASAVGGILVIFVGAVLFRRAITPFLDRDRIAANLGKSEARLRTVLDSSPIGVGMSDIESGMIKYVNDRNLEIMGVKRENFLGESAKNFWADPADREEFVKAFNRDGRVSREVLQKKADGTLFWCVLTWERSQIVENEVIFWVHDISELKEAQEEAKRSEAELVRHRDHLAELVQERTNELRLITDNLADAQRIAHIGNWRSVITTSGIEWSDETFRIYGYAPGAFAPTLERFHAAVHSDDIKAVKLTAETALQNHEAYSIDHRIVRPNGDIRWVHEDAIPEIGEHNELFALVGTVQDITERKEVELALVDSEGRYRAILENMLDTYYRTDIEGRVIMISPSVESLSGYSPEEIIGQSMANLYANPDNRVEFLRQLEQNNGIVRGYEAAMTRKDGSTVWVSTTARYVLDDDKHVIGVEGTTRDVSERKQLEEQLRRSQKMEAVGQLTGGIAHDFNNILGIIMGFVQIVQGRLKDDPELVQYLEIALDGTRRGAEITRKLLNFSREEAGETEHTSVNDFIMRMENLIAKSLTPAIKVEAHLAENLWPVEIDPGDLEDTLLNLSLNASDAMPEGGTLILETANKILDDNYVIRNPSAMAGEYMMISVSDTGTGMTDEVKEKLFEPFFTTKEVGQGTGLGLSMVYSFVERSGGHIKVYSEPGAGTTFRIYLPRAKEDPREAASASKDRIDLPRGTETVLVVDDEDVLRKAAMLHLEGLGYKTQEASNGQQALDILKEHREIELLFCDVIMPGKLDGYQVALSARKSRPDLRVLLTSGFTKKREEYTDGENHYLKNLASNLLSKPYNNEELAFAVRRALDLEEAI